VDLIKQRIELTDGKLKAAFVVSRAIKGTKILRRQDRAQHRGYSVRALN
jgi:hypothetical protein